MIISDFQINSTPEGLELSANIQAETAQNGDFRVWYRFSPNVKDLSLSADPFLSLFLIPCMYAGENLHLAGVVSAKLFNRVLEIQTLLRSWHPELSKIQVTADTLNDEKPEKRLINKGCFFSAGVDSWYSLLKHQNDISHLICIQGIVNGFDEQEWLKQYRNVDLAVRTLNKELITVKSNWRQQTDMTWMKQWTNHSWGKYCRDDFYGKYYHSGGLVSTVFCLHSLFSEVIIPSSYPYIFLEPWGSHPLLDPLWSTETMTFLHDGAESTRFEKIQRQLKDNPLALKTLTVCNMYGRSTKKDNSYNCCQCLKCLRTMLQLRLNNCLEQATSFSQPLDLDKVKLLTIPDDLRYDFLYLFNYAKEVGDREIHQALGIALEKQFNLDRWIEKKVKSILRKVKNKYLV